MEFVTHFLLASALASQPVMETYEGTARHPDGRIAYREKHQVMLEDGRALSSVTRYLDPEGRERAVLESRFKAAQAGAPYLPDYSFEDRLRGVKEGVRCCGTDGTIEVHHREDAKNERARKLNFGSEWVSGQGFHYFSRDSLERLAAGETRKLQFVIPSRLENYSFRVRAGEGTDLSRKRVEVVLEPENFVLRIFAPTIRATYDLPTRRLVHYRGPSNLLGAGGEVQTVEIHYNYPDGR